jgi:hypothetical protein
VSVGSFTSKQLRVTFTLAGNAQFQGAGKAANQLILQGLRTESTVRSAGPGLAPQMSLSVYGMRQADMQALTFLGWQASGLLKNTVELDANAGNGWNSVFAGQIMTAGPDYLAAPEVPLRVEATTMGYEILAPAAPSSYTGPTDVATVCENIAKALGLGFTNDGVNITINSPYLPNTSVEQLKTICDHAGVDLYVDVSGVHICPTGHPRLNTPVLLTPQTGLQGSPTFGPEGLGFIARSLWNPAFLFGGKVTISGSNVLGPTGTPYATGANGTWRIYRLTHRLDAIKRGGLWMSELAISNFPGAGAGTQ